MSRHIYLIEAQIGVLKIGIGGFVAGRLASVRTHSPVPVRLLATWPGDAVEERSLHDRFEPYRSHNEWFRIEGELLRFVAEVQGRGLSSIQPWSAVLLSRPERTAKSRAAATSKMIESWSDPAKKLVWLGQMRAGRLIKLHLGDIPFNDRTTDQHRLETDLREQAHVEFRLSNEGRTLIEAIEALGQKVPGIPGAIRRSALGEGGSSS